MKQIFKAYLNLTKIGIVFFVLFASLCGYLLGLSVYEKIDFLHLTLFLMGAYFLSSGSFAFNQVQERELDRKMKRTQKRPLVQKQVTLLQGVLLSIFFMTSGLFFIYLASSTSFFIGFSTIILYNGFYTFFWKKKWAFGAVPGALPGASPVLMGYGATSPQNVLTLEAFYLFCILFFWQMPHFWSLALRFKDDYQKGGIPVLPLKLNPAKTLFHMGVYLFFYLFLVLLSPLFVSAHIVYLVLVVPMALKTGYEFLKYFKKEIRLTMSQNDFNHWKKFFMWINMSLIVFVAAPVLDRWLIF